MLFSSYAFILCFLPLFLIAWEVGGRLFPDWPNIRGLILFAFSFLFYSLWGIPSLILLCCMVCLNYGLGQILAHAAREESRLFRWRKWLFAGAVALNIAPLAWFKYSLFIMENIALIIGADWRFTPPELPIGISFYTFIQIAWLAGIYKGEAELGSLWRHGLFSCCFPYVVSGPIVRQSQMGWQFDRLCAITAPNLAAGIALFCAGLAKKVLLADNAGFYADAVFNAAARNWPFNGLEAWLGSFFYTFQLYFDFSGYTAMALAIGIMVGLRLPENFNSPYKATCIVDFWHRWHITLSTWLRDFLYIPLGGNRHGKARQYLNLFLTMLIGGAWHGAGWTYIVWGGLHGLMLCVNHAWRLVIRDSPLEKLMASLPLRLACICLTFFASTCAGLFSALPAWTVPWKCMRPCSHLLPATLPRISMLEWLEAGRPFCPMGCSQAGSHWRSWPCAPSSAGLCPTAARYCRGVQKEPSSAGGQPDNGLCVWLCWLLSAWPCWDGNQHFSIFNFKEMP